MMKAQRYRPDGIYQPKSLITANDDISVKLYTRFPPDIAYYSGIFNISNIIVAGNQVFRATMAGSELNPVP